MENINDLMDEFKKAIRKGSIQKAYKYIFELFTSLEGELKCVKEKNITVNAIYHGYLDMTYLPVFTENLKKHDSCLSFQLRHSGEGRNPVVSES
jgi:hypothetical protein